MNKKFERVGRFPKSNKHGNKTNPCQTHLKVRINCVKVLGSDLVYELASETLGLEFPYCIYLRKYKWVFMIQEDKLFNKA